MFFVAHHLAPTYGRRQGPNESTGCSWPVGTIRLDLWIWLRWATCADAWQVTHGKATVKVYHGTKV
jgi:hypothetical protein